MALVPPMHVHRPAAPVVSRASPDALPLPLVPSASASSGLLSDSSASEGGGSSSAEPPRSHGSSSSEMKQRIASALTELHEAQRAFALSEATQPQKVPGESSDPSMALAAAAALAASQPASSPTMRDVEPEEPRLYPQMTAQQAEPNAPGEQAHVNGSSEAQVASPTSITNVSLTVPASALPVGIASTTSSTSAVPVPSPPLLVEDSSDDSDDDQDRSSHATSTGGSGVKAEGSISTPSVGSIVLPMDSADGQLTALQTHALEQAGAKKLSNEKGVSCHQCKTSKDGSVLLFCSNKAEKGRRKRNCRKKYCDACLRRAYHMSLEHITKEEIENWQCPACLSRCVCAACSRKHDLAVQAQQKMAAVAMQHAFMQPHFNGTSMGIMGGMRPNVAFLNMHMQMAAAAAASGSNVASTAAIPVPAIVPAVPVPAGNHTPSPFQYAQAATTLASTHEASKLPMHPHPPGVSQLPQLSIPLNIIPPHSHTANHTYSAAHHPPMHMRTMANAVAAGPLQQPQQPPHSSPGGTIRPRAYSCPTSPVHATAVPYAFPPPMLLTQQSQGHSGHVPPRPSHAKHPSLPQHPASVHMPSRSLEMQPSHEARTQAAEFTPDGMPMRRRRHSLKVTPLGSRRTSRTNSPFTGHDTYAAQHSQPPLQPQSHSQAIHALQHQQDALQMDYSLPASFSQSMRLHAHPPMHPPDQFHAPAPLIHSSPSSPRSRGDSYGQQHQPSAVYHMQGSGALPAIDLSVQPPDSTQNSAHNTPGGHPEHHHPHHQSHEPMMLSSPFQPQQGSAPFSSHSHQSHHQQQHQHPPMPLHHPLPGMLSSPHPHQGMLSSPQQPPAMLGFHTSPHVSPSNPYRHTQLSNYLHHSHTHSSQMGASPTSQGQGQGGHMEVDHAQQHPQQQQQQQHQQYQQHQLRSPQTRLPSDAQFVADSLDAEAISQLQQNVQTALDAKTGAQSRQEQQPQVPRAHSEYEPLLPSELPPAPQSAPVSPDLPSPSLYHEQQLQLQRQHQRQQLQLRQEHQQQQEQLHMDQQHDSHLHAHGDPFSVADSLPRDLPPLPNGDVGVSMSAIGSAFDPFPSSHELAASSVHNPDSVGSGAGGHAGSFTFGADSGVGGTPMLSAAHVHTGQHVPSPSQHELMRKISSVGGTPLPFLNTSPSNSPSHAHMQLMLRSQPPSQSSSSHFWLPSASLFPHPSPPSSATSAGRGEASGVEDASLALAPYTAAAEGTDTARAPTHTDAGVAIPSAVDDTLAQQQHATEV